MNANDLLTKKDLEEQTQKFQDMITEFGKRFLANPFGPQAYSINQLAKLNTIGKYTRIKSLINKGILKTLPDGRISKAEYENFLNLTNTTINPQKK